MFDRATEKREQRREERQVFGMRGTATRYRMRQSLISIDDDFWIENDQGERVFKVDGKMLHVRDTLFFEGGVSNLLLIFWEGALRAPSQKINNRSSPLPF